MFDVKKIRQDFPMLRNNTLMQGKPLVFLDNASTTFKPDVVINDITKYLTEETSNSHRGDYDLCFTVDTKIKNTRKHIAEFLNADEDEIVFTTGATNSLNTIAFGYGYKNLSRGDEILVSVEEHASNLLPWFRLQELVGVVVKFIPLDEKGRITLNNVKKAVTSKTKLISIAHVSNVLGYKVDMKEICKYAHEKGILVSCDGAQSVPHTKIDVKDMDVDFLSFSAHKMCGPTGIGALYAKKEILEKMDPFSLGGGMNVTFHQDATYKCLPAPAKFEAGTLNVEGIYGFDAAIQYIQSIGIDNIEKYEQELKAYAVEKMKKVPGIVIYNEESEAGIITFNIKGVFSQDLATFLNSRGIAARSGQHCAKILPDFLNELSTVRASFYMYTTKEEIDALVEALMKGGDFLDAYFA
ncbi:MAG: cysteine desulfurase [Bacilli bacterium]|nr:cysteine desulfurase [Bacilli bacterium]